MNLMVTKTQKSIIDTPEKDKKSKHNTQDSYQITREESKRRKKEQQKPTKTTRKQLTKWQ